MLFLIRTAIVTSSSGRFVDRRFVGVSHQRPRACFDRIPCRPARSRGSEKTDVDQIDAMESEQPRGLSLVQDSSKAHLAPERSAFLLVVLCYPDCPLRVVGHVQGRFGEVHRDLVGSPQHIVDEFIQLLQFHVATYIENDVASVPIVN